jgi:hypothetical protein
MYDLKSDTDSLLTSFINDYAEGNLDGAEISAFNDLLSSDTDLSSFVDKTSKGRKALKNAFKVAAADNFEEKLQRLIAMEEADTDILNSVTRRYFYLNLSILLRQCHASQECSSA